MVVPCVLKQASPLQFSSSYIELRLPSLPRTKATDKISNCPDYDPTTLVSIFFTNKAVSVPFRNCS